MGQDNINQIIKRLEDATSDLDISLILDSIEDETVENILDNNEVDDLTRAKIVLQKNIDKYPVELIQELGNNITKESLFSNQSLNENKITREDIFQEILHEISSMIQQDFGRQVFTISPDTLIEDIVDKLLSFSSKSANDVDPSLLEKSKEILNAIIPGLRNQVYVKNKLKRPHLLDKEVHQILKKQFLLLQCPQLKINNLEGEALYKKIRSNKLNWVKNNLHDVSLIQFDILLDLVDLGIIENKNKLLINEINNQEALLELYRLEALKHDRDLIVPKLEVSSIIRLIDKYHQESVVHYIDDLDALRDVFYRINSIKAKAKIAKIMDDSDLAFETIEIFLDDPHATFLPKMYLKPLLLLLNKKQLALLRMTSPSEYQQYIVKIVKEKSRLDDHDNAMFA